MFDTPDLNSDDTYSKMKGRFSVYFKCVQHKSHMSRHMNRNYVFTDGSSESGEQAQLILQDPVSLCVPDETDVTSAAIINRC